MSYDCHELFLFVFSEKAITWKRFVFSSFWQIYHVVKKINIGVIYFKSYAILYPYSLKRLFLKNFQIVLGA